MMFPFLLHSYCYTQAVMFLFQFVFSIDENRHVFLLQFVFSIDENEEDTMMQIMQKSVRSQAGSGNTTIGFTLFKVGASHLYHLKLFKKYNVVYELALYIEAITNDLEF